MYVLLLQAAQKGRIMKKAKLIAGMTAAIPAAAGFAGPAAAHTNQSGTTAHETFQNGKSVHLQAPRVNTTSLWAPLSQSETLYYRSGGHTTLVVGYPVYVTCYYSGAPYKTDPYWDHITKISYLGQQPNDVTGHLADLHVSLPGHELPPAAGIPHC
jgi:hypothetical protein